MHLHVDELKSLYRSIISGLGGTDKEAATFADHFVVADLRGMAWQGFKSLDLHVIEPIQAGYQKMGQQVTIEQEGESSLAFEAHGELGQVACREAMLRTIAKAERTGAAAFTIRNSGDTGLLASYTLLAIDRDCIALMFNNTNPYVAPWGGTERLNGIDPLSIAVPAGDECPILLDMSITPARVNFDKLESWVRPFTPPPAMTFETLREFLLSVTLELMSGALTDMPLGREKTRRGESAVFGIVLHIPHFVAIERFKAIADSFIRQVKATSRAPGVDEILLPGERGFREHAIRVANGIPIEDDAWQRITTLLDGIGVDWGAAIAR
jgi:LDH2 family malate/lactate/ureidoglycolate dehydrogenase